MFIQENILKMDENVIVRDPNRINNYVKSDFDRVFGEPDTNWSFNWYLDLYSNTEIAIYRIQIFSIYFLGNWDNMS